MIYLQSIALCLLSCIPLNQAFAPSIIANHPSPLAQPLDARSPLCSLSASRAEETETSFLLDEFRTHSGELIDPYKILKISSKASRTEIKQAYRSLSRRYHPDGSRHRDILPGSCNNRQEVREHWERIKLAYEILSDTKKRNRYDRHYFLADPGKAIKQAAVSAAVSGISGFGKGILGIGAFALKQVSGQGSEKKHEVA